MVLPSYSTIYNVGHRELEGFFSLPVYVEEKVDGSQFSFMVDEEGVVHCRSKGAAVYDTNGMFRWGVETVNSIAHKLRAGWIYRGEYLQKPKHNTLKYDRVPLGHIVLFNVDTGDQRYLDPIEAHLEAKAIGLEHVPMIHTGVIDSPDTFNQFLDRPSMLGGTAIEGVVIKPQPAFPQYGRDHKLLMAKYVSEKFKEAHKTNWKAGNPGSGDIVENIIAIYATEPRWRKAVEHSRDTGLLEMSPRDIGPLIGAVVEDVKKEYGEEIMQAVYKWAWPKVARGLTKGFPEWYKQWLVEQQFKEE